MKEEHKKEDEMCAIPVNLIISQTQLYDETTVCLLIDISERMSSSICRGRQEPGIRECNDVS